MKKFLIPMAGLMLVISACKKSVDKTPESEIVQETAQADLRQCAADEVLQQQIAADPQRAMYLEELERKTQSFSGRSGRFAGTLKVPVVVHIVMTNPAQVTDAQVQSQIDVLNADFGKTNSELSNSSVYLAGYDFNNVPDCDLEFYVSQIIRKTSTTATFGTNDAVKKSPAGSPAVNSTTMLNMWVCDLSSGFLGYAQFPGGSPSTDGVVIDYQAFGLASASSYPMYASFNLGRTATHEVGHWFNLRHIWGDARCGNDQVADTPQHDASNGGCPAVNHKSKCTGRPLEQWMNYMDYTYDRCMYMFSTGQKTRMDAAIAAARASYVHQ